MPDSPKPTTDGERLVDYLSLVERLSLLDTCAVSDALDSMGVCGTATGLKRRSTFATVAGRVRTIKLAAGKPEGGSTSHLGTRSIVEADDTDVIVVEQRTGVEAAGWGGVLATAAKHRGIRGVIVDCPARDIDEYERIGLPVFSRSRTPRTARGRIHQAGVDVEIRVGDIAVAPGDLVIADGTGVVFVPAGLAEATIARAETITARERLMSADALAGQPVTEVMGKNYETMLGTQE